MLQGFEAIGRAVYGREFEASRAGLSGGKAEPPQVPASAVDLEWVTCRAAGRRGFGGVGLGRPGEGAQSPQVAASRTVDLGAGGGRP